MQLSAKISPFQPFARKWRARRRLWGRREPRLALAVGTGTIAVVNSRRKRDGALVLSAARERATGSGSMVSVRRLAGSFSGRRTHPDGTSAAIRSQRSARSDWNVFATQMTLGAPSPRFTEKVIWKPSSTAGSSWPQKRGIGSIVSPGEWQCGAPPHSR
jgi:hypothetical protein